MVIKSFAKYWVIGLLMALGLLAAVPNAGAVGNVYAISRSSGYITISPDSYYTIVRIEWFIAGVYNSSLDNMTSIPDS